MSPVLRTDRLLLRAPVDGDAAAICAFLLAPRAIGVGGPYPGPREAWVRFAAFAGHWALKGYGWFTVTDRSDGRVLGMTGPHHPDYKPDRELGWFLVDGAEGRGVATEAARVARDWVWRALPPARLVSYIDRRNLRSAAVARRLGASPAGVAPHSNDQTVWQHPEAAG